MFGKTKKKDDDSNVCGDLLASTDSASNVVVQTGTAVAAAASTTTTTSSSNMSTRTRLATPWQYPTYGMIYLFTSPSMICSVFCAVMLGLIIATTSLIVLFALTLRAQAEAFAFGRDSEEGEDGTTWWSLMLAVFAVLFEATLITLLLLKLVHGKSQKKIFVKTMKMENQWRDATEHPDNHMTEPGGLELCGCVKLSFIIGLLTYPLNFLVPLLGTVVYSLLNSRLASWELMDMYFNAIRMTYEQQREEIKTSGMSGGYCACFDVSSRYVQFGFVCNVLESIPIVGPSIFPLSNACATALWASDMERQYGGPPIYMDSMRKRINDSSKSGTLQQVEAVEGGGGGDKSIPK